LKNAISDGAIFVGGRIKWNVADFEDKRRLQFYSLEPAARFADKRGATQLETLKHIKSFLKTTIYDKEKQPDGLCLMEEDIGAFVYRKLIHEEDLTTTLKYKREGPTTTTALIDIRRSEIRKLFPDIALGCVTPSLVQVTYDVDPDEFGG